MGNCDLQNTLKPVFIAIVVNSLLRVTMSRNFFIYLLCGKRPISRNISAVSCNRPIVLKFGTGTQEKNCGLRVSTESMLLRKDVSCD